MAKKRLTTIGKFTVFMIVVIFIILGIVFFKENGIFPFNKETGFNTCRKYEKISIDKHGYISGITVNLRSEPNTDTSCGKVIFQLGHQEEIKIVARTVKLDTIKSTAIKNTIDYWYEVFVYKEDKNFTKGWVFGGLISTDSKKDEAIEALQYKITALEREKYDLNVQISRIISDNNQKNQIIKNNNEWAKRSNQKKFDKQNLSNLVKCKNPRLYGRKDFGLYRMKNAKVTIINNSGYYIDNVSVRAKYVRKNGKVKYQKFFNVSIPAYSRTTYTALPNKRGKYMDIEILGRKCSALN